jgi:hypothetical protein
MDMDVMTGMNRKYFHSFCFVLSIPRPHPQQQTAFFQLIGPVSNIIDKIIPNKKARDRSKLDLPKLEDSQELEEVRVQMSAILAEAQSVDPWTSRARASFFYVMYLL